MLSNCNTLSATRLERASKDFRGHVNQLNEMKKDLESIFKRIKAIKTKLSLTKLVFVIAYPGSKR